MIPYMKIEAKSKLQNPWFLRWNLFGPASCASSSACPWSFACFNTTRKCFITYVLKCHETNKETTPTKKNEFPRFHKCCFLAFCSQKICCTPNKKNISHFGAEALRPSHSHWVTFCNRASWRQSLSGSVVIFGCLFVVSDLSFELPGKFRPLNVSKV